MLFMIDCLLIEEFGLTLVPSPGVILTQDRPSVLILYSTWPSNLRVQPTSFLWFYILQSLTQSSCGLDAYLHHV